MAENGESINVDPSRLALMGDGVGGNMVAAVTLLAKERGGPPIRFQVLVCPVTDANLETASYRQFAAGPWLTREAMALFWNSYAPNIGTRTVPTVAPLRARLEQLEGLPPALVITAEVDVVRDEGEAYAHKLLAAGVPVTAVRYLGAIHDFVLLNPIARSLPTRAAITQAAAIRAAVDAHAKSKAAHQQRKGRKTIHGRKRTARSRHSPRTPYVGSRFPHDQDLSTRQPNELRPHTNGGIEMSTKLFVRSLQRWTLRSFVSAVVATAIAMSTLLIGRGFCPVPDDALRWAASRPSFWFTVPLPMVPAGTAQSPAWSATGIP